MQLSYLQKLNTVTVMEQWLAVTYLEVWETSTSVNASEGILTHQCSSSSCSNFAYMGKAVLIPKQSLTPTVHGNLSPGAGLYSLGT